MVVAHIEHVLHLFLHPSFFVQNFKAFLTSQESSNKHISLAKHVITNLFFPIWSYLQEHVERVLVLAGFFQDVKCHSRNLAILIACVVEQQGEKHVMKEILVSENHPEVLEDVPTE